VGRRGLALLSDTRGQERPTGSDMSASVAFLFPGQGSQSVGMGRALREAEPLARARFEEADSILGRSLSNLCFEGPEDDLKQTENTQPALFVCSAAAADVLRERGVEPTAVAGHSLGEYAALYAAGALDFETGLRLVSARGWAMAEAGRSSPGAMAAVVGLTIEQVESVCKKAALEGGVAAVANDNSPGQTVISGSRETVDRACVLARETGAKRAVPLPVSGAFHSPLVEPARRVMEEELSRVEIRPPRCAFIPNVTARPEDDPATIRDLLVDQITSRVRWVESVRALAALGVATALEVGPGKVLAGLVRRIDGSLQVHPAGAPDEMTSALETIRS